MNKKSPYLSPKDVFQEVCDAIGRFYVSRGYNYTKSKPKLLITTQGIKLDILFSSSRTNTPGKFITL